MPISSRDLTGLLDLIKRLETIVKGLVAQAAADEGRVVPAGEPPARQARLR